MSSIKIGDELQPPGCDDEVFMRVVALVDGPTYYAVLAIIDKPRGKRRPNGGRWAVPVDDLLGLWKRVPEDEGAA